MPEQPPDDMQIFREWARREGMSDALIENWLLPGRGGNEAFGGGTPYEALREARLVEVIEAAQTFAAGRASDTPSCTCPSHGLTAEYRHGRGCAYGQAIRARAQRAASLEASR